MPPNLTMEIDKEPLINNVARYPWLCDKSERSYKDSIKKANSWQELAGIVGMTVDETKKSVE